MKHEAKKMRLVSDDVYERLMNPHVVQQLQLHRQPESGGKSTFSTTATTTSKPLRDGATIDVEAVLKNPTLGDDQKWKLIQSELHRMSDRAKYRVQIEKRSGEGNGGDDDENDGNRRSKTTKEKMVDASTETAVKMANAGTGMADGDLGDDKVPYSMRWIPPSQKGKAMRLLQVLQDRPGIRWTDKGVVIVGGAKIEDSQIGSLIKYALRATGKEPVGWEEFCEFLARAKIPVSLVGNAALKHTMLSLSPKVARSPPRDQHLNVSSSTPQTPARTPRPARKRRKAGGDSPQQHGEGKRGKRGKKKRKTTTRRGSGGGRKAGKGRGKRGKGEGKRGKVVFGWKAFG
jgi:hypothetical protein